MALFGNIQAGSTAWGGHIAGNVAPLSDPPLAGEAGELVQSFVGNASAVSLSSGVVTNVASIALSAGSWLVTAHCTLKYTGATQSGDGQAALSTISASLPADYLIANDNTRHTTT